MTEASCSSSQHLPLRHTEREREGERGKKKSFKVPGSIGKNMRLRSYKHTFLLVLTCISKPPTRCSWNRNQTRVRALVHAGVTIASEPPPRASFPPASLWGPACSAVDMLKPVRVIDCLALQNIILASCSISHSTALSRPPPPLLRATDWKS